MRFFDILENFTVVLAHDNLECLHVFDYGELYISFPDDSDSLTFAGDATVTVDPEMCNNNSRFDVEDIHGDTYEFIAYALADLSKFRPDRDCDPDCSRRVSPAAECDCSRN